MCNNQIFIVLYSSPTLEKSHCKNPILLYHPSFNLSPTPIDDNLEYSVLSKNVRQDEQIRVLVEKIKCMLKKAFMYQW